MEKIKKIIKGIFLYFGLSLVSEREYKELKSQRNMAIRAMSRNPLSIKLLPGISSIVFSKDRAMQLHLTLESLNNAIDIRIIVFVLYRATSKEDIDSYRELIQLSDYKNLDICFIQEIGDFKDELLKIIEQIKTDKLFFLTDDNVFIRKWKASEISNINAYKNILSLRHGLNITYSYHLRRNISKPDITPVKDIYGLHQFNWFDGSGEWSDPMSVDGHLYPTEGIYNISLVSNFKAPNTYEAALKTYFDVFTQMGICYPSSVIVNLPINLVQSEVKNKSGGISSKYLLRKWQKGFKIDLAQFENMDVTSTHEEFQLSFVQRNDDIGN